jgi:UDP-3-O-[3-hydroxymyristoyl] glucosamine N-acyltransferase
VAQDVAPGQVLSGTPAFSHREWLRAQAVFPNLPQMKRALAELEKKVKELEEAFSNQQTAISEKTNKE